MRAFQHRLGALGLRLLLACLSAGSISPAATPAAVAAACQEPSIPAAPESVPQSVEEVTLANGVVVLRQSIPGVTHTAVLLILRTGEDHDPADAPGLARLLDQIFFSASAGSGPEASPGMGPDQLRKAYGAGVLARSYHDHAVYGFVVPAADAMSAAKTLAQRATSLNIDAEVLASALQRLALQSKEGFEEKPGQVLLNWTTAKAFRHVSGHETGIDVGALTALPIDRVQREWRNRATGTNVMMAVVGNLDSADQAAISTHLERISSDHDRPAEVNIRAEGQIAREIMVPRLPGGRDHAAAAFYAPAVSHADHPAFLAVAHQIMGEAAEAASGASVRLALAFQYNMLADDRAAYLTPSLAQFPKGASQAMGFWVKRINDLEFHKADGKRALRAYDWQLGAELDSEVVKSLGENPNVIFTVAYATAYRSIHGESTFWTKYRERLGTLSPTDLQSVRDKYFTDRNWAFFVYKEKPGQ